MDLPVDTLRLPPWDPATAGEWDAAFDKIENYLRALRVASRLHRARLAALILQRAWQARESQPAAERLPLSDAAIVEARLLLRAWFDGLLPPRPGGSTGGVEQGLLALYLCDGATRWPGAFLHPADTPPALAEAMRARIGRTGPDLEISRVVPREIDLGLIPGIAGSTRALFARWPLLGTLLGWSLFIAALVALFLHTRGP